MDDRCFAFGPFVLIPQRQLLLKGEVPVRIGSRALDLLTQLVRRPGEVVAKVELIARVWAGTFVDESNLKVNIAAIRRLIDEDFARGSCIATVIGRGYQFIESVQEISLHGIDLPSREYGASDWYGIPVGRDRSLSRVTEQPPVPHLVAVVRTPDRDMSTTSTTIIRNIGREGGSWAQVNSAPCIARITSDQCRHTLLTEETMPRQYSTLTLAEAKQILAGAEAKAESLGIAYNIAVVDAGGHLLAFSRQDGALIGSIDLAIDKASTARLFDKATSYLATLAQSGDPLFGIQESNEGKVVIFGGGIPIVFHGDIIGAVGASAGTVEQDIAVAEAGAAALRDSQGSAVQ
jgi:uncharacterized protein GlcG (DUF336 family)/DNA-binding winged helix-turn-helix (wHTH) protein